MGGLSGIVKTSSIPAWASIPNPSKGDVRYYIAQRNAQLKEQQQQNKLQQQQTKEGGNINRIERAAIDEQFHTEEQQLGQDDCVILEANSAEDHAATEKGLPQPQQGEDFSSLDFWLIYMNFTLNCQLLFRQCSH